MKRKRINYRLLTTIFACISAFLMGLLISKTKVNATSTFDKVADVPSFYDRLNGTGQTDKYMWTYQNSSGTIKKLYLSFRNQHYEYDDVNNTWVTKTWNGSLPSYFYAYAVWHVDGTYYYSSGSTQLVLDYATSTWSTTTWNVSSISGFDVYYIGNEIYYSKGSVNVATNHYKLNKNTMQWEQVTWFCPTDTSYSLNGKNTYLLSNDGLFVSNGTESGVTYKLNAANHTLTPVNVGINTPYSNFVFEYNNKGYYARILNYSSTGHTGEWQYKEFDSTNDTWVDTNFEFIKYSIGSNYIVYKNELYYMNLYGFYKYVDVTDTSLYQQGYAAGQSGSSYESGYQDGIDEVTSNPSDYDLYTESQYNAYGLSRFNAGKSEVLNNPNNYGLYTPVQYQNNYTAGQNSVINNPSNYDLYTESQYNDNYINGQNSVINNPNYYNLYTAYDLNATYTNGMTAGENAVTSNPNDYDLYTQSQYSSYGTTRYNDGVTVGENNVTSNPSNYDLYTQSEYDQYGDDNYQDGYEDAFAKSLTYTGILSLDFAHIEYGNDGTQYNVSDVSDGNTITLMNMYTADDFNTNQTDYIFKLNKYISLNSNLIFNFNGVVDSELNNSTYVDFYKDNLSNSIFRVSYSDLINYNGDLKRLVEDRYLTYPVFNYIRLSIDPDISTGLALMRSNTSLTSINVANASINYNIGYNQGYDIGYAEGSNTTNESSYNDGYNAGYIYATEHASENSLVGVVGAVATTPVSILTSIFNFEFLGINVAGFILSVITLLVVIWLIKRFI